MNGFVEYPPITNVSLDNGPRAGNFTSGEIVALMSNGKEKGSFGVPYYSYIEEKKMERRLGRVLSEDVFARPLTWGHLVQYRVFKLLGSEYKPCNNKTLDHPTVECWKGTPDAEKFDLGKTVAEIKCPQTLKSFCLMVDAWKKGGMNEVRKKHKDGDKFYWQTVSNAILTKAKYGELIVYVPYQSELEAIREYASNFDGEKQSRFLWIASAYDDELPFVKDGGYYKNLNVMRFEIPVADKMALHSRVEEAAKELIDVNLLAV
jgi:hypothetical protein